MKNNFFISRLLRAVYKGFCVLTSDTGCSSYIMKTSPAKTPFQMCPFSANARPGKIRTPPDRRATAYYVESFQLQPRSMEWKLRISKVFSKTLPGSQFSGLTAGDVNNALLIIWKWTFAWQLINGFPWEVIGFQSPGGPGIHRLPNPRFSSALSANLRFSLKSIEN